MSDIKPEIEINKRKNDDALLIFFEKKRAISNKKAITKKKLIEMTLPVLSSNPENNKF